jgi:hypothetical protein
MQSCESVAHGLRLARDECRSLNSQAGETTVDDGLSRWYGVSLSGQSEWGIRALVGPQVFVWLGFIMVA